MAELVASVSDRVNAQTDPKAYGDFVDQTFPGLIALQVDRTLEASNDPGQYLVALHPAGCTILGGELGPLHRLQGLLVLQTMRVRRQPFQRHLSMLNLEIRY